MLFHGDLIAIETKLGLWLSRIGESEPADTTDRLLARLDAILVLVETLAASQDHPTTIA